MIRRRDFIKLGVGMAVGARPLFALQDQAAKVKSIIWLWMDGGMSQAHTWEPQEKSTLAGLPKSIETAVEGIRIAEWLPTCAAQMKNLSIIRSMTHSYGDHAVATYAMHTGVEWRQNDVAPAFGTVFAFEAGKKDFPLPRYLVQGPPAVLPESPAFEEEFFPFRLGSVANPIPNLRGNVASDRDRERAALLSEQNQEWGSTRLQRVVTAMDRAFLKSQEVMYTKTLNAFNIHDEPAEVRKAYGAGFGESCLMARRLVEVGCPFVEIGLGGWSGYPGFAHEKDLVPTLDRGLGNLIKDLATKNLFRETVVVCATEFGKPAFSATQDYWNSGFSIVLAGGALPGGRVYGETGREGTKSPVTIKDFFATLYKACGLDSEKTYLLNGRKVKYVTGGKPIDDLF